MIQEKNNTSSHENRPPMQLPLDENPVIKKLIALNYSPYTINLIVDSFLILKKKQESFLYPKEPITTLFLGSSHIDYGINPKYISPTSFNFGTTSQDFFLSNELYTWCYNHMPSINTVVLGISVFSLGNSLLLDSTSNHFYEALHYLYGITHKNYTIDPKYLELFESIKEIPLHNIKKDYNGFLYPSSQIASITGDIVSRAKKHYKIHIQQSQVEYLFSLINSIQRKKGKLYFLFTPAHPLYIASLPDKNELFADFYTIQKKYSIESIDAYASPEFTERDFYDADHLNIQGSKKLSLFVKEKIEEYKKCISYETTY